MKPIKVMIVDDSALVRQVLSVMLAERPGIEVIGVAVDPLFALEKMQRHWPDVLVLDVQDEDSRVVFGMPKEALKLGGRGACIVPSRHFFGDSREHDWKGMTMTFFSNESGRHPHVGICAIWTQRSDSLTDTSRWRV